MYILCPHIHKSTSLAIFNSFLQENIPTVIRVLIVDDDEFVRRVLRRAISRSGLVDELCMARNGREAIGTLSNTATDIVILDLVMSDVNGMEVLSWIQENDYRTDVIVLTGHASIEAAVAATKAGAAKFMEKPIVLEDLVASIEELLAEHHLTPHILADRLDKFINKNLSNTDLSMESLCEHFRISSNYVSKLFREHVGMSYRRRLNFYRIERAKKLLEDTDDHISEVAEQCGFKNWRRLSEVFKKFEKLSPKKYRPTTDWLLRSLSA